MSLSTFMASPSTGVGDDQPVQDLATSPLAIISYVCHGLCLLLISLCIALRLYGRRRARGSLDVEDCKYDTNLYRSHTQNH